MDRPAQLRARARWKLDAHEAVASLGEESTATTGGGGSEGAGARAEAAHRLHDTLSLRRKYFQSMSGRKSSARTMPRDSRSMAIASSPPSRQCTKVALRKYPAVVPQRLANLARLRGVRAFKYARSVSIPRTVPTGTVKASPVAHVPTAKLGYHRGMIAKRRRDTEASETLRVQEQLYDVRRRRLRQLLEQFDSILEFAGAIGEKPNYTGRLVRHSKTGRKNLGEAKARKIESALGLAVGWLDHDPDDEAAAPPAPIRGSAAPAVSAPHRAWPFRFSPRIWDDLSPAEQRRAEAMLLTLINGIEAERGAQQDQDVG